MTRGELIAKWRGAWPDALAAWSRFTQLREPLLLSHEGAEREGLTGSFAMIRLDDKSIVVDMDSVIENGVEDFSKEILAHEVGHHVIAPANLTDHGRILARMRAGLPTRETSAPMVANLYTDLYINDRLTRRQGLDIPGVYKALCREGEEKGPVWRIYMRICEILWTQPKGSLYTPPIPPGTKPPVVGGGADAPAKASPYKRARRGETVPVKTVTFPEIDETALEGDAQLGARLIRSYAREIVGGSGRFAALMLPYFLNQVAEDKSLVALGDTSKAGAGGQMDGLVELDDEERNGNIHPSLDPALSGLDETTGEAEGAKDADSGSSGKPQAPKGPSKGQAREPFEYGEILRASGIQITPEEAAIRYYRERSRPHLVPFPRRRMPETEDPLPEGLEPWEMGMPLDEIDWMQSVLSSPFPVPGMTTVKRVWGHAQGPEPKVEPVDLDLYVDSSGSMPDPRHATSYLTLAGAILCLSALRAGSRVQCTLWSGKREFHTTRGFVRDETKILQVLTGYFGGGTCFPIHILRDTWTGESRGRKAHIVQISDDGITTMFDKDEKGNSGWEVAASAMDRAGGGGTMALNISHGWRGIGASGKGTYGDLLRAEKEQGWVIHAVADWPDLMVFAKDFTRRHYLGRTP